MMYTDKTLICKDCGQEFVFTAGEQEFFAEKGFENEPQRCKDCRAKRKSERSQPTAPARQSYAAVCSACGKECTLPFEPRGDRPVFCSECFAKHRQEKQ